jgi:hypothetical protein
MKRRSFGNAALVVARGGIFSSLGVLILLLAHPFDEVLDLTVATIASLLVWFFAAEYGKKFAFCVYLSTALLSLLLTPANTGAIVYAMITGWYPLFKVTVERLKTKKSVKRLLKIAIFTLAFLLMVIVFFKLFVGPLDFATLTSDVYFLFSGQDEQALKALEELVNQRFFGLNFAQWAMVLMYLLFAPLFALLYDLLLDKVILFYAIKIRPALLRRGIIRKEYK